ncbi:MAG: hypothetical protein GQ529_06325, partial [Methyloprofundus sp.]|nr:hypothetical protein [Methyloprofundus sp.]
MKSFIAKLAIIVLSNSCVATTVEASGCSSENASYDVPRGKLSLPSIFVEQAGSIFEAKLDLLESQHAFQFQLSHLELLAQTIAQGNSFYQPDQQLLKTQALCLRSDDSEQLVTQIEMQAIPFSDPMRLLLKSASDSAGHDIFNWSIAQNKGAIFLKDRQAFDALAVTADVSGVVGVRELKFVIADLDSENPILFFMNSDATPLHYDFLRNVLKRYQGFDYTQGGVQFSADAYFRENRRHLAGSVVAYDHFTDSQNSSVNGQGSG